MFEPNATAAGYCARCGARKALHLDGSCPVAYRPDTLSAALDSLARAQGAKDQAALFVARGEVQRLMAHTQHRHTSVTKAACPLCRAERALGH